MLKRVSKGDCGHIIHTFQRSPTLVDIMPGSDDEFGDVPTYLTERLLNAQTCVQKTVSEATDRHLCVLKSSIPSERHFVPHLGSPLDVALETITLECTKNLK